MRSSTWWVLGGVGVLGVLWWRSRTRAPVASVSVPPGTSPLDALTMGLQAGIDAGTYDASAIRNAMLQAGAPGSA